MISGDNSISSLSNIYSKQLQATEKIQRDVGAAAEQKHEEHDEVEISSDASALLKAAQEIEEGDDVRWDRVAELRRQIEQQGYKIPVQALVNRLLPPADEA